MTDGMKTTEWLLSLFAMIVALVADWFGIDPETVWQVVGSAAAYAGARAVVKAKAPAPAP